MTQNEAEITVSRWMGWYTYKAQYGHMFNTRLNIPVPPEALIILTKSHDPAPHLFRLAGELWKTGTMVIPPPAPTAPPTNMRDRAFDHGVTSSSVGKAAAKGAWEGVKSSGAGGILLRTLIRALTR